MKYLVIAGIIWGAIYFALGAIKSFTLNANDTWASVVSLLALFLLPLPIMILAVWLPRVAGRLLLGCIAINTVAIVTMISWRSDPFRDIVQFLCSVGLYSIPHLFFGIAFLLCQRPCEGSSEIATLRSRKTFGTPGA